MIRQTKHILKYQTDSKNDILENLFDVYLSDLREYINLIIRNELPLKQFLSSKECPNLLISHTGWKPLIYKQASAIIRSQLKRSEERRFKQYKKIFAKVKTSNKFNKFINKKYSELNLKPIIQTKYFTIPNLRNITIEFDCHVMDIKKFDNSFDEWIKIVTPFKDPKYKKRGIQIKLPIKQYEYAKKYLNGWNRKNTITIRRDEKNRFFLNFFYEKEEPEIKQNGKSLGLDQGFKKLLSDSNGNHYGVEMKSLYEKISNKKQGSKAFKRLLIHRDNEINRACNSINLGDINHIVIESLKYVKHNKHKKQLINHQFMNKLQRWSYMKTIDKLERLCEENGILLTKVGPAYTSQTCSNCGYVDKNARNGEIYSCQHCGMILDADTNGAINILHRGEYTPSNSLNETYKNLI